MFGRRFLVCQLAHHPVTWSCSFAMQLVSVLNKMLSALLFFIGGHPMKFETRKEGLEPDDLGDYVILFTKIFSVLPDSVCGV